MGFLGRFGQFFVQIFVQISSNESDLIPADEIPIGFC